MKFHLLLVLLWLAVSNCIESMFNEDKSPLYVLEEQFYWNQSPNFQFPNATAKCMALMSGSYIPENNNIWSMGVWRDKIFVSILRFGVGVASSLNYFSINSAPKSPLLLPYPSFDANYVSEDPQQQTLALPSNTSLICTGYFRIDKCDRLWVVDAGFVDFYGKRRVLTPPALVLFDLITNRLLMRYTIPAKFVNSNTAFNNLDIDFVGRECDDAFAYMLDMFRSIVVYSLKKNRSWRIEHNFFGSDPRAAYFNFGGLNLEWNFGLLGIAIGECLPDGSKRVYVNPFASTKSYYISNKVLQNEAHILSGKYYYDVHLLGDRGKNGQIFSWAYDEQTNVLFDTQFYRGRSSCWNAANPYRNSSFAVVYQDEPLFFPCDISIDRSRNLWLLSNNLPRFFYGLWSAMDKNIQIFKAQVDDVIAGTVCRRKLPMARSKPHN